jgi:hypothetical protein
MCTKLTLLVEAEGYANVDDFRNATTPICSLAICTNIACFNTCEIVAGRVRGWCEECSTNSMRSALVLAGII